MSGLSAKDRSRSPRFPSYPLAEAVSYVERIYAGVHRSPVDAATAFKLMGFSGRSGASATALGAIRQFGLIEGIGDNTRVSDLALKILEPESSAERREALLNASRSPEVFRSIMERFAGRIPPSDEPIRAFLIRELGFSKTGVEDCVSSFRETMSFVERLTDASEEAPPHDPVEVRAVQVGVSKAALTPESEFAAKSYRVPLTRSCEVELRFHGPITQHALDRLGAYLQWMHDGWDDNEAP